jgi:repressor LexA
VLSARQKLILDFIEAFIGERGRPPTVRDIVRGCGLSSTSVADYHLNVLEREGYLRRDKHVSRGIELRGGGRARPGVALVPVIGHIAAGEPLPVPASDTWTVAAGEMLEVPEALLRRKKGVYGLRVRGNSMVDALIGDGDIVLMQAGVSVADGDTVAVWLVREKEATLKRTYREGNRIRLQPANSQMQPIYVPADNVEVQGKVVGVLRLMA